VPAEIDTPDAIGAALESQRLERNPDLRRPPRLASRRRHGPDRVPIRVDVAPFVGDLRVGFRADGVDREHEAVAAIGKRIEDQLEAVLLAGSEVLADVVDDQRRRRRVVADDADVECVGVVGETDLGRLGGLLALVWLRLDEITRRLRHAPRLFVERPVDGDRRPRLDRADEPAAVRRLQLQRAVIGRGRCRRQQQRTNEKPRPAAGACIDACSRHSGSGKRNGLPPRAQRAARAACSCVTAAREV
jgi:hypothetical protein